ncbi:hypothetical protein SCLCIDRAFT_1210441 [Scleroderma citrinum Foug A]|uniref:SAGA-associated factor 11 n=1 Tax=Scleroderma citrinum Foug A TaxID=1036808 RepID=A0A0C2ZZY8_9AGAM|nr:hypothetical protein SCLCIDRAFT_1210441 [Scleroderma citrinum Foug A]
MKLLRIELFVMYAILAVACVSPLLTCVMFYKQPRFVLVDIVHARNGQSALPQPPKGSNHEPTSLGGKTIPSGTSTPTGVKDGNILFECSVCKRQVASNRYAPHLSGCMGIGTGTRRGAARGMNLKAKQPIDTIRSTSPFCGSENDNISDDNSNGKVKGKSKSKTQDDDFNLKRKRDISPQTSPAKKPKKPKTTGSPVSRLKAGADGASAGNQTLQVPSSSQSKVPSKLRSSSTASFLERDRSATPASQSSAGTPIATSTSSAISGQSVSGGGPPKRGRPKGTKNGMGRGAAGLSAQVKRPSPPRPPPPPPPQPDYLIDVEGEETGSSTDTD